MPPYKDKLWKILGKFPFLDMEVADGLAKAQDDEQAFELLGNPDKVNPDLATSLMGTYEELKATTPKEKSLADVMQERVKDYLPGYRQGEAAMSLFDGGGPETYVDKMINPGTILSTVNPLAPVVNLGTDVMNLATQGIGAAKDWWQEGKYRDEAEKLNAEAYNAAHAGDYQTAAGLFGQRNQVMVKGSEFDRSWQDYVKRSLTGADPKEFFPVSEEYQAEHPVLGGALNMANDLGSGLMSYTPAEITTEEFAQEHPLVSKGLAAAASLIDPISLISGLVGKGSKLGRTGKLEKLEEVLMKDSIPSDVPLYPAGDLGASPGLPAALEETVSEPKVFDPKPLVKGDIGRVLWKGGMQPERAVGRVFGKDAPQVFEKVIDPFNTSKGQMYDWKKSWVDQTDKTIRKDLGIKEGSKESALVQQYGEGKIDDAQLDAQVGPLKAENIKQAAGWFKQQYQDLINQVNEARTTRGEEPIPEIDNYFRHFQEQASLKDKISDFLGTNQEAQFEGIKTPSEIKVSIAKQRKGSKTTEDAVRGFNNFLNSAGFDLHLNQHLPEIQTLANQTRDKAPNFAKTMDEMVDDVKGVKTDYGSLVNAAHNVTSMIQNNMAAMNPKFATGNLLSIPGAIADAGPINYTKGIANTMLDMFKDDTPASKSTFLKERFKGKNIMDAFNPSKLKKVQNMGHFMSQMTDRVTTTVAWNAQYQRALAEGIKNPVKFADRQTKMIVGGRGIGETPALFKDKVGRILAPFTYEPTNDFHVLKDYLKDSKYGKIAMVGVLSWLGNQAMKEMGLNQRKFDPVEAMLDAGKNYDPEDTVLMNGMLMGGRMVGEVMSNVPLGNILGQLYPEYGSSDEAGEPVMPPRNVLFGEGDPTKYGTSTLIESAMKNPLESAELLVPWYKLGIGGTQGRRMLEGYDAIKEGTNPITGQPIDAMNSIFETTPEQLEYLIKGPSGVKSNLDLFEQKSDKIMDKFQAKRKKFREMDPQVRERVIKRRKASKQKANQ